jgi:hypothetical protein
MRDSVSRLIYFSGFPLEFILAKARAGMTDVEQVCFFGQKGLK